MKTEIKQVFKAVLVRGGNYVSISTPQKYELKYRIGETTKPTIPHSLLYAFSSRCTARLFIRNNPHIDNVAVLKCMAEVVIDIYPRALVSFSVCLKTYWLRQYQQSYRQAFSMYNWRTATMHAPPPLGTFMCTWIKPKELICL